MYSMNKNIYQKTVPAGSMLMAVIAWLGLSPGRVSFLLDGRDMGAINRRLGLGSLVSCCRQYVAVCGKVQCPIAMVTAPVAAHTLAQTLHTPHTQGWGRRHIYTDRYISSFHSIHVFWVLVQ